jgi:RNA polymerase sigma-B factor
MPTIALYPLPNPTTARDPLTRRPAGRATAQELLGQRAGLPAGHPDRVTLRARSIEAALPMARALAARYRGRGEPTDDLNQVAALALIRAVDGYDPTRQIPFSSYAVPTILGALKRHFRDTSWRIRVPRNVQELAVTLGPASAGLAQQLGHSPSRQELAMHLDVSEQAVAVASIARHARHPGSLDADPTHNGYHSSPTAIAILEARYDRIDDRQALQPMLALLPVRDRRIVLMRFFDEMSQAQIAVQVGMSQMQISRILSRSLTTLRADALAGGVALGAVRTGRSAVGADTAS